LLIGQTFTEHPGQWRLLAQRPDLAPAAVEEVMRVSLMPRLTSRISAARRTWRSAAASITASATWSRART